MTIDPKTKKPCVKLGNPARRFDCDELILVERIIRGVPVYDVTTKKGEWIDTVTIPIHGVKLKDS